MLRIPKNCNKAQRRLIKRTKSDFNAVIADQKAEFGLCFEDPDNPIFDKIYMCLTLNADHYEGQRHVIELQLNSKNGMYPINGPVLRFMTDIFHPNIADHSFGTARKGDVCVDFSKDSTHKQYINAWSSMNDFYSIYNLIASFFTEPNTDSPFNVDAAVAWRKAKKTNFNEYATLSKLTYEKNNNAYIEKMFHQCGAQELI